MTKVVVDNTSPDARQRQLEAQVQVAFEGSQQRVNIFGRKGRREYD